MQDELTRLDGAKLKRRPMILALLLGLGLLVGAGTGFWVQTTVTMLMGGVSSIAGFGAILWALATGKRKAREDRARQVAGLAKRLDGLGDQIERRRADDSAYLKAAQRQQNARQELHRTANAAGIRESAAEAQILALRTWQDERRRRLARIGEETRKWGELQRELGGQSREEIEGEADAARSKADALVQGCDRAELEAALPFVDDLSAQLAAERQLQERLDTAKGALAQFAGDMASVADAEDDYEDAKRRLHHLETLDQALAKTTEFISQAQKGVYRDMAWALRSTLMEWLPQVTGGRYGDCRIDPKTLLVEVRESSGDWRDAGLLSHGTSEQVYMLLRLALCRHLVVEDETCPLILDDPVSACDGHRQALVLETLLAISASTQVVLFTHDDDVRNWGYRHLSHESDGQVLEIASVELNEPAAEGLGTRIANRFRGASLTEGFEELRGASVRPLDIP